MDEIWENLNDILNIDIYFLNKIIAKNCCFNVDLPIDYIALQSYRKCTIFTHFHQHTRKSLIFFGKFSQIPQNILQFNLPLQSCNMVLLSLFVIIFILAVFWIRHRYTFFKRHGFLHELPSFPFGNLKVINNGKNLVKNNLNFDF